MAGNGSIIIIIVVVIFQWRAIPLSGISLLGAVDKPLWAN